MAVFVWGSFGLKGGSDVHINMKLPVAPQSEAQSFENIPFKEPFEGDTQQFYLIEHTN